MNDIFCVVDKLVGLKVMIASNDEQTIDYQNNQCVITTTRNLLNDFIEKFTNIIEFEAQTETDLKRITADLSIDFLSFKKYNVQFTTTRQPQIPIEILSSKEIKPVILDETDIKNKEIILSTSLIESKPYLIELFESKLKLVVYERDYSTLSKTYNLKCIEYADILINEYTGVLLVDPYFDLDLLIKRLNYLKYQLDFCFLIIFSLQNSKKIDKKLIISMSKIEFLKIKIINVNGYEELKEILVKILSNPMKKIENSRFLSVETTLSEVVLLSSCCFNAYSAQFMANMFNLNKILSMNFCNFEVLFKSETDSLVPFRVIKNFYQILNKSTTNDRYNSNNDRISDNECAVVPQKNKKFTFKKENSFKRTNSDKLKKPESNYKLTFEKLNKQSDQTRLVFKFKK
jgi:hypothetical protein